MVFSIFLLRVYSCNKNANLHILIDHDIFNILEKFLNNERNENIIVNKIIVIVRALL